MEGSLRRTISRRLFIERALSTGTSVYVAVLLGGCSRGRKASQAPDAPVDGAPTPSPPPTSASSDWKRLRVGAGGFVTGISIVKDGTKVVRTDTHNAYIWNEQRKIWDELFTRNTLPQGDVPFPAYGGDNNGKSDGPGCWEVAVANSNSSVIYGVWNALCYRSTDRGKSFQKTALQSIHSRANDPNFSGGIERFMGPKMAIDPANANVVWVSGDMGDGLYVTADGGGTWTQKAQIPTPHDGTASKTNLGPYLVVFDPSSPVVGGKTQGIYVASYGHGLFQSRDGGATFKPIAGGPTKFRRLTCDQLGRVWICDEATIVRPIRKYENGTWSAYGSPVARLVDVAVNPADPGHIVAWGEPLTILQSKDNGATWQDWVDHIDPKLSQITRTATDIPWLAKVDGAYHAAIAFDPSNGKCFVASGIGVFYVDRFPDTNATRFEIISQSVGIEQLCVWRIMAPPGGTPITVQLDRSAMKLSNPDVAPATYGPSLGLKDGFDLDYSLTDPAYVVMLCAKQGNFSGYSRDRGDSWTYFPGKDQMSASPGGSIAVSTPINIVHVPGNNGVARYTLDGGSTWLPLSIQGLPTAEGVDETGWGWLWAFNRKILCADKVQPGVFYAYNYGPTDKPALAGLWKTTDGGRAWTQVKRGTIGQWTTYHTQMNSVPENAGHLFFTAGREQAQPLYRSTDGGATWTAVAKLKDIYSFGFGKAADGAKYPTVFVCGRVNDVHGIWRSIDNCATWKKIGEYPLDSIDVPVSLAGDPNIYGRCYLAYGGSGAAYVDSAGI
jgi:photosystem II stability/assembly factor-like uncharacterized protein